jgi:hypothetical protein
LSFADELLTTPPLRAAAATYLALCLHMGVIRHQPLVNNANFLYQKQRLGNKQQYKSNIPIALSCWKEQFCS